MTTSGPPRTEESRDDLWPIVQAVGADLDRCAERLADPDVIWAEADAAQLDSIVMVIDDLQSNARHARTDGDGAGLAELYESPISTNALGDVLDELAHRASLAREQAWERAGRPVPMFRSPEPALGDPVQVMAFDYAAPDGTSVYPIAPDGWSPDGEGVAQRAEQAAVHRGADRWGVVIEVLTVIGVMIFVFVIYAVYGTGLAGARSQRFLDRELEQQLRASVSFSESAVEQDSGLLGASPETPEAGGEAEEQEEAGADLASPPEPGDPMAVLSIPTLGVRQVVVEGTRPDELTTGPGHLRSSPAPGRAGNSVIFGRRTTYGGPFADLDDLEAGDPIDIVTTEGYFRYVVQAGPRRIAEGEPDPITTTFSNRLTLVTSDERYASNGRLIVYGLLEGAPVPTPTDAEGDLIAPPTTEDDELGTQRSTVDWAWVALLTLGLVGVYMGTKWLYRHWLPWSTWLVSAPVFVLVALAWLDSLARLFPSTL